MTALESQLESVRSSASAKPKFSFQRKSTKASTSSSISNVVAASNPQPSQATSSANSVSTYYRLSSRSHQYLTPASLPPSVSDQPQSDLTISDLDHCVVNLCSVSSESSWSHSITALHVQNLRSTILVLPNLSGSVLLNDLDNCVIVASCHQVGCLPHTVVRPIQRY